MKRKVLEDFYTPIKKLNPTNNKCSSCKSILLSKSTPHICQSNPITKHPSKNLKDSFQILMSTNQSSTKSNFHLDYLQKSKGRHIWRYSFENTSNAVYKSKVHKLKQTSKDPREILLTFTTNHIGNPVTFFNKPQRLSFAPSTLKSILHKAVRRKNRNACLKTALQLGCNFGIRELARRLCVIILEDTFLHEDLPLLVWCMGVGEYEYTQEMLESIMQIVSDLAEVDYLDILDDDGDVDVYGLWKKSEALVRSILIRGFYRGMAGDVIMLNNYAQAWNRRWEDEKWREVVRDVYKEMILFKDEDVAGEFTMNDVLIEGIDQQCSGIIEYLMSVKEISNNYPYGKHQDLSEYLNTALWTFRGGINFRKPISEHPLASSLISYQPKLKPIPDNFYLTYVLPHADSFGIIELNRRFNPKKIAYDKG
ncbi:hypothetical protein SteCoe_8919 [Stentor coeruleus]|uniref:Uncharacterized protein n=1 Tax=Stentor coeruleus TaxID=5963 RepID=A0A1R2CIY8_9CILI|nr:hypothetical protein SteCoe_8919 [Stentor coeruleus]